MTAHDFVVEKNSGELWNAAMNKRKFYQNDKREAAFQQAFVVPIFNNFIPILFLPMNKNYIPKKVVTFMDLTYIHQQIRERYKIYYAQFEKYRVKTDYSSLSCQRG